MKIQFDQNHLLTIENENIPQTKEYTYSAGGYTFSDFDKGVVVLHKKDFKITNLKNLGDGMNVIYLKKNINKIDIYNKNSFSTALTIFHSFNEETWATYAFIPNIWEKELQEKNETLKKLKSDYRIEKTAKWIIMNKFEEKGRWTDDLCGNMSFLFWLLIMYGKFDVKNWLLASIKIQIPLFWEHLIEQNDFDGIIKNLRQEGIFLKSDKLTNKNGITYQISSNDYELLEIFAKWYEPVEKFEKISKREFSDEMKSKLIEFIETNPEIPSEGKAEVLEQIKNGTIKFLMK